MELTPHPESQLHSRLDAIATRWSLVHQAHVDGAPQDATVARQMLRRARLRFAEALVDEVARGLADPSPGGVADELAQLGLLDHVKDFLPADWAVQGALAE